MKPIKTITSIAAPLDRVNVDTDQIIPKQFLKRIERTGYGDFLFYDWRRIQEGPDAGKPDATFVLNEPQYKGAEILLAGKNFGCGSSREHAAWALADFGFRCVIAPTFADIFYSNAGKNGIVLVTLPEADVQKMLNHAVADPSYKITMSLEDLTVSDSTGYKSSFTMDAFRRYCLLEGLDDIGLTMRHAAALEAYDTKHEAAFWLKPKLA
jgi:3-isopropylmalate/(R)-2-methylmalate dehydratase small subunit